jgi:hypothetical protein
MGGSVMKGEGRVVRPREARASLLISNYSVMKYIGEIAIVKEF